MALPAGRAQLGEDFLGVVAALAGDDDVALGERRDVVGVLQLGVLLGLRRGLAAGVRGREEDRFDMAEVAFSHHAVHQDRTHHAAPAHEADQIAHFAHRKPFQVSKDGAGSPVWFCPARLAGWGRDEPELYQPLMVVLVMAATTASPISRVLTRFVPSDQMSAVR